MLLLACGCVIPLLLVAILVAALGRGGRGGTRATGASGGTAPPTDAPMPRAVGGPVTPTPSVHSAASRWETLAEEIARRGGRRPLPRSDGAARRRHLASVLPADARR